MLEMAKLVGGPGSSVGETHTREVWVSFVLLCLTEGGKNLPQLPRVAAQILHSRKVLSDAADALLLPGASDGGKSRLVRRKDASTQTMT